MALLLHITLYALLLSYVISNREQLKKSFYNSDFIALFPIVIAILMNPRLWVYDWPVSNAISFSLLMTSPTIRDKRVVVLLLTGLFLLLFMFKGVLSVWDSWALAQVSRFFVIYSLPLAVTAMMVVAVHRESASARF